MLEDDAARVEEGLQRVSAMPPRQPGGPELLRIVLPSTQQTVFFYSPTVIRLVDRSIAAKLFSIIAAVRPSAFAPCRAFTAHGADRSGMIVMQAEKDGVPLRRGGLVRESATIAAEREQWARQVQQNVRHLVLVVHGIGQRLQDARFSSDVRR